MKNFRIFSILKFIFIIGLPISFNNIRLIFAELFFLSDFIKFKIKLIYNKPFLSWELSPYNNGTYVFHVNMNNLNTNELNYNFFGVPLDKEGHIGLRPNTKLRLYVKYHSPKGWFVRSDILSFLLLDGNSLEWTDTP